jgi:hypothetical protein
MVSCTAEFAEENDALNAAILQPEVENCVDDHPQVRITNNGTDNFDFTVIGDDYAVFYEANVGITGDTGFIELTNNNVIIIASNDIVYGQKIPLSLVNCDIVDLEIDENNVLIISSGD